MQRQSPAVLALRAAILLFLSGGMMVFGVAFAILAKAGPLGALSFIVMGIVFGTVMISATILSSYPAPAQGGEDQKGRAEKPVE